MKHQKKIGVIAGGVTLGILLSASSCSGKPTSVGNDQKETNSQMQKYQAAQPVPQYDWSQYRQTLIDAQNAQVTGVATTTFFFNQGSAEPFKSCPSIGFPVPITSQLTNPDQTINHGNDGIAPVGQAEPNGTYTGDSSGTYVVCVEKGGAKVVDYWEGFVETEGGPAHFDNASKQIVLDGNPTVTTKAHR
jgi:hypothetical protein